MFILESSLHVAVISDVLHYEDKKAVIVIRSYGIHEDL